ncbi:HNH endonuclease [Nocardioides aurantiacus]|nr:HNH endonuclease [Nocardioides aurantiacus]
MCGTHYNQTRYTPEQRHRTHDVACVVCGTQVRRRVESKYAPTCSVTCRTAVQWGEHHAPADPYTWRRDAITRAKRYGARIVDEFDRGVVFDRDDWLCQECGITCTPPDPYVLTSATVDHVVSLAAGGPHSLANARTCCLSCNSRRAGNLAA